MSHYYFGNHHRLKNRFLKRVKTLAIVLTVLIVLVAGAIITDTLLQKKNAVVTSDSTIETKSAFLPTTQVFRTSTFQFQAANSWKSIPSESTDSKFIYRSLEKQLVLRELDIYVNTPQLLAEKVTYVIPVDIVNGLITPKEVSKPCKTGMPSPSVQPNARLIIFDTVSQVFCNPSGEDYTVLVGVTNGSSLIKLKRPDGSSVVYQLVFKDVTVSPDPRELTDILQSFQPR